MRTHKQIAQMERNRHLTTLVKPLIFQFNALRGGHLWGKRQGINAEWQHMGKIQGCDIEGSLDHLDHPHVVVYGVKNGSSTYLIKYPLKDLVEVERAVPKPRMQQICELLTTPLFNDRIIHSIENIDCKWYVVASTQSTHPGFCQEKGMVRTKKGNYTEVRAEPKYTIGTSVTVENTYAVPVSDRFAQVKKGNLTYRSGWIPPNRSIGRIAAIGVYDPTQPMYGVEIDGGFYVFVEKGVKPV